MSTPAYAEVVLPIALDQALTYSVPDALRSRVAVGMRAVVPVQKRVETGYIVGLSDATAVEKTRPIRDLPDPAPVFRPEMLELCRWLAGYYCCSWGEALQTALPAGINVRTRVRYRLVPEQLTAGRFTDMQRKVVAELHRGGPRTEAQLAQALGRAGLRSALQSLQRRGIVIDEPETRRAAVSVQTETYVHLIEDAVPPNDVLATMQRRAPKQAAVYLDLLHGDAEQPATALYEKHKATAAVIKALVDKGLVMREEREFYRAPSSHAPGQPSAKFPLNIEQQAAYDTITAALRANQFQTYLLRGITGSGKTEVYLQAIEAALELGKSAIILVPEISLTPQTVGRFQARFDTDIAVLHSGLGTGERYDEWRRAQRGDVRIVVGARSAVFAPLPNLGMIIVDEEHDTSYKQGDTPRYHARDTAIMRARMNDAVCVLGSATPSVESFHNTQRGKSLLLELKRRATNAELPEVTLVDMREVVKEHGGEAILSPLLEAKVTARVEAGEQVILLLNRRGFAPFALCPGCGWVAMCTDCHVTLTYHAKGGHMRCHYCNAQGPVPGACAECGFNPLLFLGTGTQKVEDFLMRAFPQARVERMDADTTAGKGGHAKILGRFAKGEIDILIGTQMLAKGHDYPGVTLVGVINADAGLALPDFRAAENVFQLLTQVGGRAGRGGRPGEVIIQTYRPRHYAIQAAAHHDYDAFYTREIGERERASYPPFRRMANIAVECEDPLVAEQAIARLRRIVGEQLEAHGFRGIDILGPAPATIRRVKKKYRWNLGLMSRSSKRLNTVIRATRAAFDATPGFSTVLVKVDFDPYGMF